MAVRFSSDETILLLDVYLRHCDTGNRVPGKNHQDIRELSELLRKINNSGKQFGKRHRNPTGIARQFLRYKEIDSSLQGDLRSVGKLMKETWNTYIGGRGREEARKEIGLLARSIRNNLIGTNYHAPEVHDGAVLLESDTDYTVAEAREGRILTRLHVRRERDGKLVARKKEQVMDETGRLECEACTFDFAKRYGDRGRGFIEVHHTLPLHTLTQSSRITPADLALLCSNCHRIVHREKHHWLTMQELHTLVETHRAASH